MESWVDVSFVIPCFNEEKWISTTLSRIKEELNNINISYEIIVVDNKSQDNSADIASFYGAKVYSSTAKTVAAVRNYGFTKTSGDIIVFLDGDVHLSPGWGNVFFEAIQSNKLDQKTVTGSHCSAPDNLKEPLASWYKGIENDNRNTHLGTGHMIMFRVLFEKVGMFNEDLKSGEDFDFCQKVMRAGGRINSKKCLKVYHMDYPLTISEFVKRECWHGSSDFENLSSIVNSKVAIASLIFLISHLLFIYFLITGSIVYVAATILFLSIFIFTVVLKKFGYVKIKTFVIRCLAAYFYLLGRFLSMKNIIFYKKVRSN